MSTVEEVTDSEIVGTGGYVAAWLDPEGEFHVAETHSSFTSEVAKGYAHLPLKWVRVYFTPTTSEIGFEFQGINQDQRAALLMLAKHAKPNAIYCACDYMVTRGTKNLEEDMNRLIDTRLSMLEAREL